MMRINEKKKLKFNSKKDEFKGTLLKNFLPHFSDPLRPLSADAGQVQNKEK